MRPVEDDNGNKGGGGAAGNNTSTGDGTSVAGAKIEETADVCAGTGGRGSD